MSPPRMRKFGSKWREGKMWVKELWGYIMRKIQHYISLKARDDTVSWFHYTK